MSDNWLNRFPEEAAKSADGLFFKPERRFSDPFHKYSSPNIELKENKMTEEEKKKELMKLISEELESGTKISNEILDRIKSKTFQELEDSSNKSKSLFNIEDTTKEIDAIENSKEKYWESEEWKNLKRKRLFLILKQNKFKNYMTGKLLETAQMVNNFIEDYLKRLIQRINEEEVIKVISEEQKIKKEYKELEDYYKNL
ncbi:MAG TPA: hypothetical protein VHA52_09830 [Candidatus Babeliaceae bacterium]|nr:hypothetical protein [Candidatus Babeliaceae bacterium]